MPTPVTAARQCLTEEAARALDEAVAVARRRSHAQTTSLHAVSALLSLPSSTLRDACARARSSAHTSRLQFRALELCVGVSLDRLPSSKSVEDPPISNSLMAAIKRSQANQRRHPESYHLQQLHSNNNNNNNGSGCSQTSLFKVELKFFILSILDDPIVSRVFGEAGFSSCDIKLALVHPPVTQVSRFSSSRCPPIFLCNLTDSVPGRVGFNFPFAGQEDGADENCRRIGEVMGKKSGKSPLLVGVCAMETLRGFTESLARGKSGILNEDLAGLNLISIEKEVNEFVIGGNEETLKLKFKEMEGILDKSTGSSAGGGGVLLNFGDLKGLISDGVLCDSVSSLVLKLTGLVEVYRRKLWFIGAVASVEMYRKFTDNFPNIEKEWDLRLLPITSSKSSFDGVCSKSSLMGSFVPFGGFFPTASDLKSPFGGRNQSTPRCNLCNEKYEQEVAAILKVGSTVSVADQYSENLPSWLRIAAVDTSKGTDAAKTKDGESVLNTKILGLQKKWNDICQCLHHTPPFHKLDITPTISPLTSVKGPLYATDKKQNSGEDLPIDENRLPDQSPSSQMHLQKIFLPKCNIPNPCTSEAENISLQSRLRADVSALAQQTDKDVPWFTRQPRKNVSSYAGRMPSSFVSPVTTDLKLGTIHASTSWESNTTKSLDTNKEHLRHLSGSISTEFDVNSENTSFVQSSSCSGLTSGEQFDQGDYKSIRKALVEKVGWQDEAVNSVSQAISQLRSRNGSNHGINRKGNIWLTFLGPDRVGKRRIASALAEVLFGSQENLICVDLSSQDKVSQSNSIFECQELNGYDVNFRGKTVSDFIAEELRKKLHSVIFLENVDKADYYVQHSLDQAIRTGKFPDSHGREVSINNMVFITTSAITKGNRNVLYEKKPMKFSEDIILGAKSLQLQIIVGSVPNDVSRSCNMRVTAIIKASTSASVNKRKLIEICDSSGLEASDQLERAHKASKSCLDLNLPVEDTNEENGLEDSECESLSENTESWLEGFFSQVHKKIHFKPFDFDGLADKIVKEVSTQFQRIVGSEVLLEIDQEVMMQILAAAWLSSDRKGAVEDWIENVLCRSFAEAHQKYHFTSHSVVKLSACEGVIVNEQAPGICLPAKVNLN